MVSTVAIIAATVYGLARTFINRPGRNQMAAPQADPLVQDRLDRLESAIQAIATQTERIADGQRFTTRLLSQTAGTPIPQPPLTAAASSTERRPAV